MLCGLPASIGCRVLRRRVLRLGPAAATLNNQLRRWARLLLKWRMQDKCIAVRLVQQPAARHQHLPSHIKQLLRAAVQT